MPTKDPLDAKPANKSNWSDAFNAVSRLAAARDAAIHQVERDRRGATSDRRATASGTGATALGIDPGQRARAVAEIEQASATLQRSEPALEIGLPEIGRASCRERCRAWGATDQ